MQTPAKPFKHTPSDEKEIADMRATGVPYTFIVKTYEQSAERWEAIAERQRATGNVAAECASLKVATALRRVAMLSAKLAQQETGICANTQPAPAPVDSGFDLIEPT